MFLIPDPTTVRWILARLLGRPFVWVWLAVLAAAWPALAAFSPVALTARTGTPERILYEIAFLSLLAGCTLALAALGEGRWLFERAPRDRRRRVEWTGLTTGGLLLFAIGLAVPLVWTGGLGPRIVLGSLLALAHLSLLGLVILRLPVPSALATALLPIAAWLLPAVLVADFLPLEALRSALDASRHLREIATIPSLGTAFVGGVLPIIALGLCARLLEPGLRRQS